MTNGAYRDIAGLTSFLKLLLWLGAALSVVAIISGAMQMQLLSNPNFTESEAAANDQRQGFIGIAQVALYLLTVVIFARWILLANRNVRALGAEGLRCTPGWAVGYYFVPIVNLWKPYQAMKDLWQASRNPREWQTVQPGGILPLWWALWIITNILGQISFRLSLEAKGISSLLSATRVQIVADLADIPLCLVAAALVLQIQAALAEADRMRGGTPIIPPAPIVP